MSTPIAELVSTDHVRLLDESSFPTFIEENKMVFISFIHKLLPKCARLIPIFEQTAQTMQNSGIRFAQMDCLDNTDICRDFQLAAYPVIILFQGIDKAKIYHGAMRENEIVAYLTRQSFPTISTIETDTLEDFKKSNDVVVVGYFSPDDNKSHEAFSTLAEGMRDHYLFGVTCDHTLAKTEEVEVPRIAVYKTFDERKSILRSTYDSSAMSPFVKTSARPLVVEFLPEFHDDYFNEGIPLGYIFAATSDERARLSKMVLPLAKKYKDQVLFGTVEKGDIGKFPLLADAFWFEVSHWPSFKIREPVKNLRFPFDEQQELSEYELDKFVEAFIHGKLKPTIKSEPVPDVQKSPVIDVVALNYDEIVMNEEKDVLLEFCTQWCGPCRAFRPTYEKLALHYSSDKILKSQVDITTIDAEANDFPDRDVRGFPWFKFFPADAKVSPILYFGPREIKDIAEFIRDNGKHKAEIDLKSM